MRVGGSPDEEAAFWFARMRSDDIGRRDLARFNEWIGSDPANAQAYEEHKSFWDSLEAFAPDDEIVALRRDALALEPARTSRDWHKYLALAASLAILLVSGLLLFQIDAPSGGSGTTLANAGNDSIYRTEVGQRSTITLTDGSVVMLNTDSLIEVRYAQNRRDIRLLRGQALFRVARDASRPFVVEAADQRIVALGTEFDVRFRAGEVRVTLLEGRVTVERDVAEQTETQRTTQVRQLEPGQQLVAVADRPFEVLRTDVTQAVSWPTGRVVFNDEPLGQVVEEINRYSTRKVLLEDPTLADLRVSGVFQAGSVGGFVTALDAAFPVASRSDADRNAYVISWE